MALDAVDRRTFVKGATAVGGGIAMGAPLAALTARTAEAKKAARVTGYGPLYPTPEADTGITYLALPRGFQYRLLNKSYDPSLAQETVGGPFVDKPTPTWFDGMGAFPGPRGTTILVRNHEARGAAADVPVVVPPELRYDKGATAKGGLTRLVVKHNRLLGKPVHVLGGTHTNCAGGQMPWGSWVTCEEVTNLASAASGREQRHGYNFEFPSQSEGPVKALPIRAAGYFSHEAVAWWDGVLYQTEDVREQSGFYRYRPQQRIRKFGDLAASTGPLEALAIKGQPGFDGDALVPGQTYPVEWVLVDNPEPADASLALSVRQQARNKGAVWFDRLEGAWESDGKIYFDATEGGSPDFPDASGTPERELGQVFEYDPARQTLKVIFASPSPEVLQNPDNLVVVPRTGHVFVQEDSDGLQWVRGITTEGEIYDFAQTVLNDSEFCGGCFDAKGKTFFLNQQGDTTNTPDGSTNGLTYAIWGPFKRAAKGQGWDDDDRWDDDDDRDERDDD